MSFGPLHRDERGYRTEHGVLPSAFFALECPIVEPQLYRDLGEASRAFNSGLLVHTQPTSLRPFLRGAYRTRALSPPQRLRPRARAGMAADQDRGFLTMINANKLPRLYVRELLHGTASGR